MSLLTVLGGAQHPTLTALSVTVQTGGSAGKLQNYSASAAVPHVGKLPPRALPIVVPPWEALPGDNSPLNNGLISGRHFINAPTTDTNPVLDGSGLLLYGRHAAPIRGTINQTADSFNSYIKAGSVHRLLMETSGEPGATNLLYNPTATAGYNGWTRTQGATTTLNWSHDNFGGGRFVMTSGSLTNGSYDGWEQVLSVNPTQNMVLSGILETDATLPAGCSVIADVLNSARNAQIAQLKLTSGTCIPLATAFYTGSNSTVVVRFYVYNNQSGATQSFQPAAWYKLQLEYGTQPSAYVDHGAAAGHNSVFGALANGIAPMLSSSTLKTYVPNSLANLLSDVALSANGGSSGSTTIQIWMTSASGYSNNPAGATLPSWMYPDGSGGIYPPASACGSSTSPLHQFTGLTSGHAYYFVIGFDAVNNVFTNYTTIYSSPPTQAQIATVTGDGTIVAVVATASSGSSVTAGGGTHSISGGGGHQVL